MHGQMTRDVAISTAGQIFQNAGTQLGDQGPAWKGAKKAGIELSLSAWSLQGEVLEAVAAVMSFTA